MLTALTPNPYVRLCTLSIASFGMFSVLPVFWSMPTAFLSGAAAAAGVAYINSIANIAGFVGNYVMGWLRDLTGSLRQRAACRSPRCATWPHLATLCIHHDKELEQTPIPDDREPVPGGVAEIV